jgi:hypothetical protein
MNLRVCNKLATNHQTGAQYLADAVEELQWLFS